MRKRGSELKRAHLGGAYLGQWHPVTLIPLIGHSIQHSLVSNPSNTALRSLEQVKTYLQTQGTCKCGLECPLNCDIVFNFDPKVASKPWSAGAPPNHLTGLCNHKRKAIASLATSHHASQHYQDIKKLEAAVVRRKKRKTAAGGPVMGGGGIPHQYGGAASVSQILAQREREQRISKDGSEQQQHAWNDGMPMSIPAGSSPVIIQNNMIVNPANGRVQYPPGYHEHTGSGSGPMTAQQQPSPTSQYFRFNPATGQQNASSALIENDMMCNNQSATVNEFSGASNAFNHSPNIVMDGCEPGSSIMLQDGCTNGGQSAMVDHSQQHGQNFMPQQNNQQRISVDGNSSMQHCVQVAKPHAMQQQQQQQQVFMQNQEVMNHQMIHHQMQQNQQLQQHHHHQATQQQQNQNQQQIQLQQMQQSHQQQQIQLQQMQQNHQQQHQIQSQHHQQQQQQFQHQMQQNQYQNNHHNATVPIQHNTLPTHIINTSTSSSSPRPSNSHVVCQSAAPHQNVDPGRMNQQFHHQNQQQVHGIRQHEQGKSVQHVHVVDGNKVSCNQQATKTSIGGTQVLLTSGLNNRGIVCDNNYSTMQQAANRNEILQHQQSSAPTTMIIQTSQGQVMIPTAQAMASGMLVQSQPANQNGNQSSQVHSMNIAQSPAVVVQGGHAAHINSQGQATMVLHHQNPQQGLQVQTVVGGQQHHMPSHHQQRHHVVPSSGSNVIPAGSGINQQQPQQQQQHSLPSWQQNKQIQNQQMNQNVMINNQQVQQQQQQHQQQHIIQQHPNNPYERVPPLHHQQPQQMPVWQQHSVEDNSKKKYSKVQNKTNLVRKQRSSPYSNDHHHSATSNSEPCPNVDVRNIHNDQKNNSQPMIFNNVPSFMEDPSGYLAQQTALLNSTISRQTGAHSSNMICHSPCGNQSQNSPDQNSSGHVLVNVPSSACSPLSNQGVPVPSNVMQKNNQQAVRNNQLMNTVKVYRSNSVSSTGSTSYQNQSQPGTPDSSDVTVEKSHSQQNRNDSNNLQGTIHIIQKQMDDSPVTSSTFIEQRGHHNSKQFADSRGPIQGGTVSTSNRSPVEGVHRIQPPDISSPGERATPTSSTQICRSSPESPTTQNILVSVSSPFVNHSASPIILTSHPNVVISRPNEPRHHQQPQQLSINIQVQDVAGNRIPAIVTTMASGHTVSSNTITSVLAGRANTATVSVNNPSSQPSQTATPPVLTNQPAQVSQNQMTKSPLEMVQSVVSSIQVPNVSTGHTETAVLKQATGPNLPPGHILVSSNGQLLVANTNGGPPAILSPQQNLAKIGGNSPMPPMSGNSIVTNVTGAVTQLIPAAGVTQQVLGQPTVLVNALPAPLLFQPSVMTVDGTMNAVQIPHLAVATNNTMLQPGQMVEDNRVQQNGAFSPRTQQALLSPDSANSKRKANLKKRKVSPQTVANMLHIAAQQTSPTAGATGMVMQQPQPQQSFQNSAPMLQALTILPSKSGHLGGTQQLIATTNVLQPLNFVQNFPTIQQFIVPAGLGGMVMATGDGTATLLPEAVQLNVLTPVQGPTGTVFSHAGGQSILTGPAGMVIRTPNNNQNAPKVQHVGQGGQQFIANSPNQFLMQSSPAATFSGQLSPMLNVSPTSQPIHTFNTTTGNVQRSQNRQPQEFIQCGQTLMVPCSIAQAPPAAQNTTVVQQNTTIVQQQTTMVSNNQGCDQNQGPASTSSSSSSSSLSLNQHNFILNNADGKQGNFIITTDKQNQGNFILSPNPDNKGTHIILNNISPNNEKQSCSGFLISQSTDKTTGQMCDNFILTNSSLGGDKGGGNFVLSSMPQAVATGNSVQMDKMSKFAKHSVSTQTAANQQQQQNVVQGAPQPVALIVATSNTFSQTSTSAAAYSGASPPDTTTHSPVSGGQSPGLQLQQQPELPSSSMVGSTDETGLSSPTSSSDVITRSRQPMVQCVSSSNEQDSPPPHEWGAGKEGLAGSPSAAAIFSPPPPPLPPPPSTETAYGRGGNGSMKTVSVSSYVESSTVQQYEEERLHKHSVDESLSHQAYQYHGMNRVTKRKHSQMCSDSEARIHTSTLSPEDDDDDSGGGAETNSETDEGGSGGGHGQATWCGGRRTASPRGRASWWGRRRRGPVWVRWFGGGGGGQLSEVQPDRLEDMSQGLEAHHALGASSEKAAN
ncbi:hypothetical protein LSTR_LSTR005233 [Laodelphax striatellus]|uniref:MBD domain-containing protein n=1 Tax=Laodelphax striatellus TaxID=195883 RepID=A0A482XCS6_LAOST|nr:hypothetical protein LSTR_LSTR005233 [Laodelphax striatellus]